jgi:ketosteroid isomerase-like protein
MVDRPVERLSDCAATTWGERYDPDHRPGAAMTADGPRELVERVYRALAAGDRAELEAVLHPEFDGYFSPGMPAPIGGHHAGAGASIDKGWWAIGAAFAVRAQPERWLACGPTELLVLGTYEGRARRGGGELRAPFAHLWTGDGDRLRTLHQYTDTAAWQAALEEAAR